MLAGTADWAHHTFREAQMMAQMIVGQSGGFAGIGGRYHAAAGGFVFILVLATGLAVGFSVVVERLITPGAASVSAIAARETVGC
jgi:hypothetical protein